MAFRHGRFAELTVDGNALSAFCDAADLSIEIDPADTTTFLQDWKRAIAGLAGGKLELKGNYDPTATTGPAAVLTGLIQADPFPVIMYPGGNISGQVSHTFNAILTAYAEGSPVGDKVTFSASILADGEVTTAVIA